MKSHVKHKAKKQTIKRFWLAVGGVLLIAAVLLLVRGYRSAEETRRVIEAKRQELAEAAGKCAENTILLPNTSAVSAEAIADKLGAEVRLTAQEDFACLYLPEGTSIQDVYADENLSAFLPSMSPDYYAYVCADDALAEEHTVHTLEEVAAVEPTCTEPGQVHHWVCTLCGKCFADEDAETELTEDQLVIPALGFDYTVTFSVLGDTSVIPSVVCNSLTGISLPDAEGPEGFRFLGWVEQDYDNVTAAPETVLTGAYVAPHDVTLLALFTWKDYGFDPPALELMTVEDDFADGDKIVIVESGGVHGLYHKSHNYAYVSDFAFTGDVEDILADELTWFTVTKVDGGWYLGDEINGWLYTPDNHTNLTIRYNTAFMTAWTLTTLDGHLALQHTVSYNDNVFYVNCGTNLTGALTNKWRMVNANNMSGVSTLDIYKLHEGGPAVVRYTTVPAPVHEHTPGEPVRENEIAATCTEAGGYDEVVYCTVCGEELSREHVEVPALGHDWDVPTYEWAEDNGAVTATRVCRNDADHVETETAATTSEVTKEATYDEEGEITFTAVFENPAFETQTKTIATPKLEKPVLDNPFVDVAEGAYYYDPVLWAVNHDPQITNGTSSTTFSPDKTCTRAQVVTFLWRAKGCPEPEKTDNPFTDVKEGTYYYKAVLWAVENGVTTGTGATTFSPDKGCTRAQVVTFLWRAEGQPAPTNSANPFTDVTGGYYYDAVLWAVEKGITNGTSATTFGPDKTCTRGQIVTFLYRDLVK